VPGGEGRALHAAIGLLRAAITEAIVGDAVGIRAGHHRVYVDQHQGVYLIPILRRSGITEIVDGLLVRSVLPSKATVVTSGLRDKRQCRRRAA
jgi:hypothetical protein